jgi:hypothetical protein
MARWSTALLQTRPFPRPRSGKILTHLGHVSTRATTAARHDPTATRDLRSNKNHWHILVRNPSPHSISARFIFCTAPRWEPVRRWAGQGQEVAAGPFDARPLLQGVDLRRSGEIEHSPMATRVLPTWRIGGGAALEAEAPSARQRQLRLLPARRWWWPGWAPARGWWLSLYPRTSSLQRLEQGRRWPFMSGAHDDVSRALPNSLSMATVDLVSQRGKDPNTLTS